MPELEIGRVSDFFAHPSVAGVDLSRPVKLGDTVHIQGHTTDFILKIDSMQIDRVNVSEAKSGDSIGIKVEERVRHGDKVYKIVQ